MNNSTIWGVTNGTRTDYSSYGNVDTTKLIASGTVLAIEFGVAFFENLLVVLVFLTKIPLKTRPINSLILSLAIADLLQAIFQTLPTTIQKFQNKWTMGSFVCKMYSTGRSVLAPAGLLVIALIGVERYRSLERTDGVAFSVTTTRFLIVSVWVVCLGVASPLFAWFDLIPLPGGGSRCGFAVEFAAASSSYTVVTRILFFVAPMIMTWTCYLGVIYRLTKSSRKVASMQVNTAANLKRQKTVIMVSRTCILIAVVFTVCWTPFSVSLMYTMFEPNTNSFAAMEYCWLLAGLASCINPIIYGVMWKSFRESLIRFLRCKPARDLFTTTQA